MKLKSIWHSFCVCKKVAVLSFATEVCNKNNRYISPKIVNNRYFTRTVIKIRLRSTLQQCASQRFRVTV